MTCTSCSKDIPFVETYLLSYEYEPLDGDKTNLRQRRMKTGGGVKHLCHDCLTRTLEFEGTPLAFPPPRRLHSSS